ncbi:MAG: hypothetical protein QOC78_493 [Solirubrobacteraceae bacterium]|jgi:hypothetical protein|nr:hypothetical protein [Solirubrobacteraceae bacterium]
MLACATCGSRWDEQALSAATFVTPECPLCGGELRELGADPPDDTAPVHADVARTLREHLLGVGA